MGDEAIKRLEFERAVIKSKISLSEYEIASANCRLNWAAKKPHPDLSVQNAVIGRALAHRELHRCELERLQGRLKLVSRSLSEASGISRPGIVSRLFRSFLRGVNRLFFR